MPDTKDVQSEYLGEEPLGLILPRALLGSDLATSDNAKSADVGLQKADDDLQKADDSIKNVVTTLGLINHPDAMHYVQRYFNDCGEADLASINPNQLHPTVVVREVKPGTIRYINCNSF